MLIPEGAVILLQLDGSYVQGLERWSGSILSDSRDSTATGVVAFEQRRAPQDGGATEAVDNGTAIHVDAHQGSSHAFKVAANIFAGKLRGCLRMTYEALVGKHHRTLGDVDSKVVVAMCSLALIIVLSFVFVESLNGGPAEEEHVGEKRSCWSSASVGRSLSKRSSEQAKPLRSASPQECAPIASHAPSFDMNNSLHFFTRPRPHSASTSIPTSEARLIDVRTPISALRPFSEREDPVLR